MLPRWKKEAKHLFKGSKKFIHYKRDLLKEDRVDEIESRRGDLLTAMKAGDKEAAAEAGKQLRATCEQAMPMSTRQNAWEENVEVIFVALVVALGLRAYVLQPFRIPTGSMQPTLNGIIIEQEGDDFKMPWFGKQAFDWAFSGKTYKNIVADRDKQVTGIRDASWFLFTRTEVKFSDGSTVKIPAARGETEKLMGVKGQANPVTGKVTMTANNYSAGDPILRGVITTGDLVLVDKFSYHFRKPKRGEVFVFDTRSIPTSGEVKGIMGGQSGGQHYIKRLCAVPGDELSIDPPYLMNKGAILQESGIKRVAEAQGEFAAGSGSRRLSGYGFATGARNNGFVRAPLEGPDDVFKLKADATPALREYAALGDNTGNSLDSRYWGKVHGFNVVGPALFSLWPFGSGHWGTID
ncbi:signal peptidase I [Haloferula sp.]|uniref:signal peptidase I n=1 Tax=Haloferula sp. TaxID=2497595 RepID=UPI00329DF734